MSLCTVSELRTTLGVGTLYPDATLQEVCDAADAVLLPMLWSNKYYAIAFSNQATTRTLYFQEEVTKIFAVGQSITVSNAGSNYNGSQTITGVGTYSITFTGTSQADVTYTPLAPFGVIAAATTTDWTTDSAVQTAALEISVDIWQSRQVTSSGGSSPDFQPSPYRMGNTLMARVRGLIAHALDPQSMVG